MQQIDDPRLRIIRQRNQGQTSALITGIKQAKGDLIARLDDDDYSLPNRLMHQLEFMEAHQKFAYVVLVFKNWIEVILFLKECHLFKPVQKLKKL